MADGPKPACGGCGSTEVKQHCPGKPRCTWVVCLACKKTTDRRLAGREDS